ncbi:MAG: hypothetical protein HC768_23780 [Acaryochloris sp. CRU_2_0]|nr:hypothetical protein [Acaryochloris sp. CRU_2_0]
MLTTNIDSGEPLEGDLNLQSHAQPDFQVIEEYKSLYLQCAILVQSFMFRPILDTYDNLFRLGCNAPELSLEIDQRVGYQLKLSAYSQDDRFNILYHGPYIQSQIVHHFLSKQGAKTIVRQLLQISPIQELSQSDSSSSTAA